MLNALRTSRLTTGIYKNLADILFTYLLKNIESVIEVVVKNNDIIISVGLFIECVNISDSLAGGTCDLIVRIFVSDIFLKKRRYNYNSVFAVVCGCWCVGCFAAARNFYKVLNGTVFLLQTASFLLSYLERKEVIHLQKRFHLGSAKLPSLLMATGFLLFIPSLLLKTL